MVFSFGCRASALTAAALDRSILIRCRYTTSESKVALKVFCCVLSGRIDADGFAVASHTSDTSKKDGLAMVLGQLLDDTR